MSLINLKAFDDSEMAAWPWRWALVKDVISVASANNIVAEMSTLFFKRVTSTRMDKQYSMDLLDASTLLDHEMSIYKISEEIRSLSYKDALGDFVGHTLAGMKQTINLWRYEENDYLSPHKDKTEKFLSHLIYLNEHWDECSGGLLNVLETSDEDSAVGRIIPKCGNSAIILNCEKSWHSVSPVNNCETPRYCIQVIFWK